MVANILHPINALRALNRVHTNTTPTDCTGEHSRVAKKVKPPSRDHEHCLLHIDSQSLAFHTLFPYLQPCNAFFKWVCYYSKIVSIQKLPWHTSTELARQSFQHTYEKQGAENRSLMNTNSNSELLAVLTLDMYAAFDICIHVLDDKVTSLFDLILYVPSTIFQLDRDGSSWVEPVQS